MTTSQVCSPRRWGKFGRRVLGNSWSHGDSPYRVGIRRMLLRSNLPAMRRRLLSAHWVAAGRVWPPVPSLWVRHELRASLPLRDGTHRLAGVSAPVTVTRDALGIPTIQGRTREDVARATGFLHAQDRFFQMDLTRRRAAGELAALVGRRALPADRKIRRHRFRAEASTALSMMSPATAPSSRRIRPASTAGWTRSQRRHSSTCSCARRRSRGAPKTACSSCSPCSSGCRTTTARTSPCWRRCTTSCPRRCSTFMASPGTEWDAPVVGERFAGAADSGPGRLQPARAPRRNAECLRSPRRPPRTPPQVPRRTSVGLEVGSWDWKFRPRSGRQQQLGRLRTTDADSAPLVANDMHLDVRVPNTWYRAQFEWPDGADSTRNASARRRHASRLSSARRRQQHVHRLGLHQHLR